jgi:hypothetical protein
MATRSAKHCLYTGSSATRNCSARYKKLPISRSIAPRKTTPIAAKPSELQAEPRHAKHRATQTATRPALRCIAARTVLTRGPMDRKSLPSNPTPPHITEGRSLLRLSALLVVIKTNMLAGGERGHEENCFPKTNVLLRALICPSYTSNPILTQQAGFRRFEKHGNSSRVT